MTAWLALAMSSTLAGNLTVLGSVANLIVVEIAPRGEGAAITFWDYARRGGAGHAGRAGSWGGMVVAGAGVRPGFCGP